MAIGSLGSVSYDIVANDRTGPAVQTASTALVGAGAMVTAVGAAGLYMFNDWTSAATTFSRSITEVFTLLPSITQERMDEMASQAIEFAETMGFTLSDVATAMYQAISAGVSDEDVFAFLETSA